MAETVYWYAERRAQFPPEVLVSSREDLGWEEAREESALPQSAASRTTGAALVRILKQPDGSLCGDEVNYVDESSRRGAFGLPGRFIAADYPREPVLPPAARGMPAMLDLVIIEYSLNEWVRQNRFASGTLVGTQFLHFKDLPKDLALARLDKGLD